MAFTLESGIPVPKATRAGRSGSKYPFAQMEVGESFLVGLNAKGEPLSQGTVRSALGAFSKRNPNSGKFAVRDTDQGVRVWRTE